MSDQAPDPLHVLIDDVRAEKFFGEIRIRFRDGAVSTISILRDYLEQNLSKRKQEVTHSVR